MLNSEIDARAAHLHGVAGGSLSSSFYLFEAVASAKLVDGVGLLILANFTVYLVVAAFLVDVQPTLVAD